MPPAPFPMQRMLFFVVHVAVGPLLGAGCVRASAAPISAPPAEPSAPPPFDDTAPLTTSSRPSANFVLAGEPFCFLGANNYYVSYKSQRMTDDLLDSAHALGLRVLRVWGFIDRGSLDGQVPDIDGDARSRGVYFQYWNPGEKRPAYNDGPTGLEHLDYLLDQARKRDLKVMIVLTNNWRDFGGVDQYVAWFGQKQHHRFYDDAAIKGAFQDWAAHLVRRKNTSNGLLYRDDPTIFGWELGNEPRCTNGKAFDDQAGCAPEILTRWADEMTTFIKSIDPNHLVSVGDEGFFARGRGQGFGYDGSEGVDHGALLRLPHVDFGTYHLYPDTWIQGLSWAHTWINQHIALAQDVGKPTLLEEYGVKVLRNPQRKLVFAERRERAYVRWNDIVEKRGGNGALFWMLAGRDDEQNNYPDYDHFTAYAGEPGMIGMAQASASFAQNAQACRSGLRIRRLPPSPFVTVSPPQEPLASAQ